MVPGANEQVGDPLTSVVQERLLQDFPALRRLTPQIKASCPEHRRSKDVDHHVVIRQRSGLPVERVQDGLLREGGEQVQVKVLKC